MSPTSRRARAVTTGLALLAITLAAPTLAQLPASAADAPDDAAPGTSTPLLHSIGDPVPGLSEVDRAGDAVLPTAAQTAAAKALGGDVSVSWNAAGTPSSVFPQDGVLAPA